MQTLCCLGRLLNVPMTEGWTLIHTYEAIRNAFVAHYTANACHASMLDDDSEAAAQAIYQQWLITP